MKATTEMEIKITGGRIIGAEISADGVCKLTVEVEAKTEEKPKVVTSETPTKTPEIEQTVGYTGGYGPHFWDWDPNIDGDD